LAEYKKRLDEELSSASAAEEYKKKIAHDVEVLDEKVKTLLDTNDKLNKSKKKLMSEVRGLTVQLYSLFPQLFWYFLLSKSCLTGVYHTRHARAVYAIVVSVCLSCLS